MGGFFAPDPPAAAAAAPVVVTSSTTDAEAAAAQERLDAIDRNRRGLYGTIATNDTGALQPQSPGAAPKTLLGD